MSQQSELTSRGSVSSLQAAISEVPEWLRSDEAASGCVQHACLLLWISAPLTSPSWIPQWDVNCQSSPAPHVPQLKQRGRGRHRFPSWSSWPHITVAHLSDPLTVFTQADVLTSPAPVLASTAKAQSNIFSLPWAAAAAWRQEVREVNSRFLFGIWEKAQLRPWARQISCKQRLQLGTMVGGNLESLIQAISALFKLESGLIRPTYKEEVWFLEGGEGGMFNCPPTLFPPQFLFSVTLTTQSPSPQTSLVFLHVELSLLHAVLENTFIRHYTFSGGAKIPVCWLQCFFFFFFFFLLAITRMCFWLLFPFWDFTNRCRDAANITSWSHNLPESLCDELQTSPVRWGQMFTGVSNLITAENREKTSKCNWTGCKATGHPLRFYGMGWGGSSEAI